MPDAIPMTPPIMVPIGNFEEWALSKELPNTSPKNNGNIKEKARPIICKVFE